MKSTLTEKLTSFKGTIAVADQPEYLIIWQNQGPLDFTDEMALARTEVAGLGSDGAEQSAPITGSTEALATLRQDFETNLHILARATYRALLKQSRTEDAAKVDLIPSKLHDARALILAGLGETVLDLAEPLTVPPAPGQPAPGERSGVTAAFFAKVDDLWDRYSVAVGAPLGARAKRKALTSGLPAKFREVEERFAGLDDLVIQYGTTVTGQEFVAAWFNARKVVELGRRSAKPKDPVPSTTPASPTPPTT